MGRIGYGLMVFLAISVSFAALSIHDNSAISSLVYAHDGDGDGIDDDTLLPVVDEASSDPFPGSGEDFEADLTALAITSAGGITNSTGSGHVHLLWSENQERLRYNIELTGISVDTSAGSSALEAVTKIHIHQGAAGATGPHALNIFGEPAEDDDEMRIHLDDNEVHGVWGEIDTGSLTSDTARSRQLSDMREKLCDGQLYFQIHTNWNPAGAIRGQIEPRSELCDFNLGQSEFSSTLTAGKVILAGADTAKTGDAVTARAEAHFDHTQSALFYRITFSDNVNLDGTGGIAGNALEKLHIHQGAYDEEGDHLLNVFGSPCFVSGLPDPITDPCDDAQMKVNLSDNSISGVWDDSDRTLGTGTTDHSRSKKISDHIGDLCNDRSYFQAHFGDGNIRGQIELDNHDLCDFDPNHSDFVSFITEDQIAGGGTRSAATGSADFRFSYHGDELQYDIYLNGLDADDVQTLATTADDLHAVHFRNAPVGVSGPVHLLNIFGVPEFSDNDYILQPGNGTIFGIWDDGDEGSIPNENERTKRLTSSIDALCSDEVYIHVSTVGFTNGEIRGQILKTPENVLCDFRTDQVPDFTATLNECYQIRAVVGASHTCHDDEPAGHDHDDEPAGHDHDDEPAGHDHDDEPAGHDHDDEPAGHDHDDEPDTHGHDDEPDTHGHDDEPAGHGHDDEPDTHDHDDEPAGHGHDDEPDTHDHDDEPAGHGHDDEPDTHGHDDEPAGHDHDDEPDTHGHGDEPDTHGHDDEPDTHDDNADTHRHGGSGINPEAKVSMWFNDAYDQLYYELQFTGVDTTKQQTLNNTSDDLHKIHVHNGTDLDVSGNHAFNILFPSDDPDVIINNGTRVVSGIWGDDASDAVSLGPTAGDTLSDYYSELCNGDLYFQIHNASAGVDQRMIRGQIEVNGHDNAVCDPPSLLSARAVSDTKILLLFDKALSYSTNAPFTMLEMPVGTQIAITSNVTSVDPLGNGLVTINLPALSLTNVNSTGTLVLSGIHDLLGIAYDGPSRITVDNALGNVPLQVSPTSSTVSITADSQLSDLVIPDDVESKLDLSSTITNPQVGKTRITLSNALTVLSANNTDDKVSVELPAGLQVTGNSIDFDGLLTLPSSSTSSCTTSFNAGENSISCIELGVPGIALDLNIPVKINLVGDAGNRAFYSNGAQRIEIAAECDDANTPNVNGVVIANTGPNRECHFDDYANDALVIWTSHLSQFGSWVDNPSSTPFSGGSNSGGGRGGLSALLNPSLILYNTCDANSDGVARIITSSSISRGEILTNIHADNNLIRTIDVTEDVSYLNYIDSVASAGFTYRVFDAIIPFDVDKFWVTVYDKSDMGFYTAHLVKIPKNACFGSNEPFPLRDDAQYLKPFEPLEISTSLHNVESLMHDESVALVEPFVHESVSMEPKPPVPESNIVTSEPPVPESNIVTSEPPVPESNIVTSEPPVPESNIVTSEPPVPESALKSDASESSGPAPTCGVGTVLVDGYCQVAATPKSDASKSSEPAPTCGVGTVLVDGYCQVAATLKSDASKSPEPAPTCGVGTVLVDGYCKVTVNDDAELNIEKKPVGLLEQLLSWFVS